MFSATYRTKHWGMLLFRLILGGVFVMHGYQKLDPAKWEWLGSQLANFGITFAPSFWGFMAMFAELVGGAMIIMGFLYIPALALTAFTMLVAMSTDLKGVKPDSTYFEVFLAIRATLMLFVLSVAAMLMGPGKFSIDALIGKKMCGCEDCPCDEGTCCTSGSCACDCKAEEKKPAPKEKIKA